VGLERPAPPPTLCAQADTPLGTPQGLQDLPLTTPTQRTLEKTQTASMWRMPGLLRSMFEFAQHSAGDLWQLHERASLPRDQDIVSSRNPIAGIMCRPRLRAGKRNILRPSSPPQLRNNPQAIISPAKFQPIPCKWPPSAGGSRAESTMAGMVHVPLLGMHMDKTPSKAPWTSGSCSILLSPAAKTTPG
jgi:hypothetical protein